MPVSMFQSVPWCGFLATWPHNMGHLFLCPLLKFLLALDSHSAFLLRIYFSRLTDPVTTDLRNMNTLAKVCTWTIWL